MSKCWYCNNELTSGDSPKHFGICNKCYDKMFKSGDTIIRSLTNKISDLEAKLKALQNGIIDDETLNMLVKEHKLYKDLETKLAESEKKAYSRGHSQRDIANEIKLNALREDVANKEKRIVELKQQLEKSEKSKESYRLQNEDHHLKLLQFYSRLGVEAFGADIHEKALETLMIMKEEIEEKNGVRRALSACNRQNDEFAEMIKKLVSEKEELKQQLADKDEEIEKLNACVDFYKSYYISFKGKVIDELEKVKRYIDDKAYYLEEENFGIEINEYIDNQINGLKGKVEDEKRN